MKRYYSSILLVLIIFSACSKSNNSITVEINGSDYPTTTIGDQIWTTVNYHGEGGFTNPKGNNLGNYYNLSQALAISLPTGWHVPTIADYNKLLSNYTSNQDANGDYYMIANTPPLMLISTSGWQGTQGTNSSGLNMLPAGYYVIIGGATTFYSGTSAYFVTADSAPGSSEHFAQYGFWINNNQAGINAFSYPETTYLSLRFIKNK